MLENKTQIDQHGRVNLVTFEQVKSRLMFGGKIKVSLSDCANWNQLADRLASRNPVCFTKAKCDPATFCRAVLLINDLAREVRGEIATRKKSKSWIASDLAAVERDERRESFQ